MQSITKRVINLVLGCSIALAFGGFMVKAGGQGPKETPAAVPAEQVIASIRTAIAAQPGDVRAVEIENERGKSLCEIEILAPNGKTYEVEVDVATNTVIEVEAEDDDDDDGDKN